MKKQTTILNSAMALLLGLFTLPNLTAQIVINEIDPANNTVELKNTGVMSMDVSTYQFCSFPTYNQLSTLTLVSGSLDMAPGSLTVISGHSMNVADGELGLYLNTSWTNSASIIDYVEWGFHGHTRSTVAEAAGIWEDDDFVDAPGAGESLQWDGTDDSPSSWFSDSTTLGEENVGGDCDANGGQVLVEGSVYACVNDGSSDLLDFSLIDASGTNMSWMITDEAGVILDLPDAPPFDFEGAVEGICYVYHISYEDDATGIEAGENISDFGGCYGLSDPVEITRWDVDAGIVETSGGETNVEITVNDGLEDVISFSNNSSSEATYVYVITDVNDIILGIVDDMYDFDDGVPGECRVYGVSYSGDLLEPKGGDLSELSSTECFEITEDYVVITKLLFDSVLEQNLPSLNYFPSVGSEGFTIQSNLNEFELTVFDITGKVLQNKMVQESNIEVSVIDYQEGIYLILVESPSLKKTFRFVKTN